MLRTTSLCSFCPVSFSASSRIRHSGVSISSTSAPTSRKFFIGRGSLRRGGIRNCPSRNGRPLEICCSIADTRKLGPLPLEEILTKNVISLFLSLWSLVVQGTIHSTEDETTKASVFAIFDSNKKLQYIGFSKGLRDSLRTIFTRRPDKAYFFKSVNLTKLDQKGMVQIRDAWFQEVGGPPVGNKLALEKAAWQQPLEVGENGSTSKAKAAEESAEQLIQQVKERGCTEEFIANPEFLPLGQVDLVLVDSMTEEEIAEKKAKMEAINKATRFAKTIYQEEESEFSVYFKQEILTNGGTMFDVTVSHDDEVTSHRVIVGGEYYEDQGIQAQDVVMQAFAFVIEEELERQTEGLLLMTQFPINYFTVADLDQRFPEYREHFKRWTGITLSGDRFWGFTRVEDYGPILEQLEGYETPVSKYGDRPMLTGYD